jgi:hypothetical protein
LKTVYFVIDEDIESTRLRYLVLIEELLTSFNVSLLSKHTASVSKFFDKFDSKNKERFSFIEVAKLRRNISVEEKNKALQMLSRKLQIPIPHSGIELWKTIVLDDLAGNIEVNLYDLPPLDDVSLVVTPIYKIGRQGKHRFLYYYQFQLYKVAKKEGFPLVGIEFDNLVSPYYYTYNFYDYFIVKSEKSEQFLKKKLNIDQSRIFVLRDKYNSILFRTDVSPYQAIQTINALSSFPEEVFNERITISVVHNPTNRYAFRKTLRALKSLKEKVNLIMVSNAGTIVTSWKENEILKEAYKDELKDYPHKLLVFSAPDISPNALTLFSDYVIYTDVNDIEGYKENFSNVLLFNPFIKEIFRYIEWENTFSDIYSLSNFLNNHIEKQKKKYTLKQVLSSLIRGE